MDEQPKCQHRFPSRPITEVEMKRMRSEGQHHRRCPICAFYIWDQYWHDYKKEGPPPPPYDYNDLMKELKSYEEIVEEPPLLPGEPKLCWGGLLRNHPNAADFFYDQSHGELSIRVRPAPSDFSASLMVHSIDDGSIVLLGPTESLEKAEKRALLLKAEVEEWGGWIPTKEQVEETARKTGCYWNL